MKKWTIPLIVLLTVLLLIGLVFLPALAGVLQDAGYVKELSYWPLHSIVPYISEKGSGLDFVEKLAVMHESEISVIVPALASMTQQQVRTVVEEGIKPYVDAGIVKPYGSMDFHVTPYVAISWQDKQQYFLFWIVELTWFNSERKSHMSVRVDDETGAFLSIEGYDLPAFMASPMRDELHTLSDSFARTWLEQVGLWDSTQEPTAGKGAQQVHGEHPDYYTTVYEISTEEGDPLCICFSVNRDGGYQMWLEMMPR